MRRRWRRRYFKNKADTSDDGDELLSVSDRTGVNINLKIKQTKKPLRTTTKTTITIPRYAIIIKVTFS